MCVEILIWILHFTVDINVYIDLIHQFAVFTINLLKFHISSVLSFLINQSTLSQTPVAAAGDVWVTACFLFDRSRRRSPC